VQCCCADTNAHLTASWETPYPLASVGFDSYVAQQSRAKETLAVCGVS